MMRASTAPSDQNKLLRFGFILATDFVLTPLTLKHKSMIQNTRVLLLESVHLFRAGLLYGNSNPAFPSFYSTFDLILQANVPHISRSKRSSAGPVTVTLEGDDMSG